MSLHTMSVIMRKVYRMRSPMQDDYVECADLSGKTIQTLRIYKDSGNGTEIQIVKLAKALSVPPQDLFIDFS